VSLLRQEATIVARFRIVEYADQEAVTAAARRFACSRTTVYRLVRRYAQGGLRAVTPNPTRRPGSGGELRAVSEGELSVS